MKKDIVVLPNRFWKIQISIFCEKMEDLENIENQLQKTKTPYCIAKTAKNPPKFAIFRQLEEKDTKNLKIDIERQTKNRCKCYIYKLHTC